MTKVKYLGLIICAESTQEEGLTKRIETAHATITSLVRRKMLFPGVNATFATMLFFLLSQSNFEYACLLCPGEEAGQNAFNALLRRFFGWAFVIHMRTSQLPRLIAMFNLNTLGAVFYCVYW